MDKNAASSRSWYSEDGKENDVVLSTRLRLSRNLANFPFPAHFRGDDAERVQALVFDAFSKLPEPDSWQMVNTENIDESGVKILTERGILDNPVGTGLVMGPSDNIFCMVNCQDHVRLVAFAPGLDAEAVYNTCLSLDKSMQQSLQFAASYDFGFLTSVVKDCGSGMKISVRLHLPSVSYAGKIPEITEKLNKASLSFAACFGPGKYLSPAMGAFYQVATTSACSGTEFDQLAGIVSSVTNLVETERKFRLDYAENIPTVVRDSVSRSVAMVKFSHLVTTSEAIEIISNLKWGLSLGLLSGIEHKDLSALLYRIQEGHLRFVLKNSSFKFEKDVESDIKLKVNRFRSLILQEAFENIKF